MKVRNKYLLVICGVFLSLIWLVPACADDFSDVSDNAWYSESVHYVYTHNLMQGVGNGIFNPEGPVTRGMLVTILYRMEGSPETENHSVFHDVQQGSYYQKAVIWADNAGIVNGYGNDTFAPDDYVTREQFAAILCRYVIKKGLNVGNNAFLSEYSDAVRISSYALDAMKWANANNIINGMTETTLAPQGISSRAQTAAIIMRYNDFAASSFRDINAENDPMLDESSAQPASSKGNSDVINDKEQNSSHNAASEIISDYDKGKPALVVSNSNVSIQQGTFNVDIILKNNPGLSSLMFNVLYDDALVLKSVKLNNEWIGKAVATVPEPLSNPQTISIIEPTGEIISDGLIATLVFSVSSNINNDCFAEINVTYNPNNVFNKNLDNVALSIIKGSVNITK